MATIGALVDMREGTFKIRLNEEKVFFRVYKTLNTPSYYRDVCMSTLLKVDEYGKTHTFYYIFGLSYGVDLSDD